MNRAEPNSYHSHAPVQDYSSHLLAVPGKKRVNATTDQALEEEEKKSSYLTSDSATEDESKVPWTGVVAEQAYAKAVALSKKKNRNNLKQARSPKAYDIKPVKSKEAPQKVRKSMMATMPRPSNR